MQETSITRHRFPDPDPDGKRRFRNKLLLMCLFGVMAAVMPSPVRIVPVGIIFIIGITIPFRRTYRDGTIKVTETDVTLIDGKKTTVLTYEDFDFCRFRTYTGNGKHYKVSRHYPKSELEKEFMKECGIDNDEKEEAFPEFVKEFAKRQIPYQLRFYKTGKVRKFRKKDGTLTRYSEVPVLVAKFDRPDDVVLLCETIEKYKNQPLNA